jgi:hypothetical protein
MTEFDKSIARARDNGHHALANRIGKEKRIASMLVREALRRGFMLSVYDCEEWTVIKSRDYREVMSALFTTDDDRILLRDSEGKSHGHFWLVYGNCGYDVICDYSDTDTCNAIWDEVLQPLSDKLCA